MGQSRTQIHPLFVSLVLIALFSAWPLSAHAQDVVTDLKDANHSADSNPDMSSALAPDHSMQLMRPALAKQLQSDYEIRFRSYEIKQQYSLTSPQEDSNFQQSSQAFAKMALRRVANDQWHQMAEKTKTAASNDPDMKALSKPAIIAATAVAIYSGQPIVTKLDETTKMVTTTNGPSRSGSMAVQGTSLNGGMTVATAKDPSSQAPRDRYTVAVGGSAPLFGGQAVRSGVSYGGDSQMVVATLSKNLFSNLDCQLSSSHAMDPSIGHDEQAVRLVYDIRF